MNNDEFWEILVDQHGWRLGSGVEGREGNEVEKEKSLEGHMKEFRFDTEWNRELMKGRRVPNWNLGRKRLPWGEWGRGLIRRWRWTWPDRAEGAGGGSGVSARTGSNLVMIHRGLILNVQGPHQHRGLLYRLSTMMVAWWVGSCRGEE